MNTQTDPLFALLKSFEDQILETERNAIIHSAQAHAFQVVDQELQQTVKALEADPAIAPEQKADFRLYLERIAALVQRGLLGSNREALLSQGRLAGLREMHQQAQHTLQASVIEKLHGSVAAAREAVDAAMAQVPQVVVVEVPEPEATQSTPE